LPNVEQALCDTGPVVAMVDRTDLQHDPCLRAFEAFAGNLVTSWPVISEAFYLLHHPDERDFLWKIILTRAIAVADLSFQDLARVRSLMKQYADQPMDLADASLVVLAERFRLRKVFTLDRRHFSVYRPRHAGYFELIP
jgi:predicted nucleic acid-binding protein